MIHENHYTKPPFEMLSERYARALELLAKHTAAGGPAVVGDTTIVPSCDGKAIYFVTPSGCSCPDATAGDASKLFDGWCKHRIMVHWLLARKPALARAAILAGAMDEARRHFDEARHAQAQRDIADLFGGD